MRYIISVGSNNHQIGSWSNLSGLISSYALREICGSGENYGIHLTVSGGNSNYAVYAQEGQSYFAENVGVGKLMPEAMLNVDGSVRFENLDTSLSENTV